jgi:hypothetical protein
MGVEIHLIQEEEPARCPRRLNPKSDHLSFMCQNMELVEDVLSENGVEIVVQSFPEDGLRQVSFTCF